MFGTMLNFTTPYTYAGGPLLIQVNDVSPSQTLFNDTLSTGQTTGQSVFNAGSANATAANEGPFTQLNWAVELDVTPVPEPSSLISLRLVIPGAGRSWRRKAAATRRS